MVIELNWRFPFVHPHTCRIVHRPVQTPPHRSWVKTDVGRGWLDHHEADGWMIRLESGALVKRKTGEFEHLP